MDTNVSDIVEANPSRNVTYDQMRTLIDFMGQHVDLATGGLRTLEARHISKKLWADLTKMLNNVRFGTKKSSDAWSKYWSDFKNKLKRKVLLMRKRKMNGITDRKFRPLTGLEKRAFIILGPHIARKVSLNRGTDPFNSVEATSLPEVKQESLSEDGNGFSQSEHQQSEADKDSNMSDSSNDEVEECDDQVINNLYPKWLIDIEKKRADAELIKAKAEVQKASIVAKNAEVALMQAESLKKLSEAAEVQAESMLRIAIALEGLVQNRNILEI